MKRQERVRESEGEREREREREREEGWRGRDSGRGNYRSFIPTPYAD